MDDQYESRKTLADEFFVATGCSVSPDDPIITGSLYFTHKITEATAHAVAQIQGAASLHHAPGNDLFERMEVIVRSVELMTAQLEASASVVQRTVATSNSALARSADERQAHSKFIQQQIIKCVERVARSHPTAPGIRFITLRQAGVVSLILASALVAGVLFGIEYGSARAQEAAIGRAFSRSIPTLEPKLKEQLLEHIQKVR